MHNHKFSWCKITNSHDAQSQTLTMHNHKHPSCTITDQNPSYKEGFLNILYHSNPHHDPNNLRLLLVNVHAGKIFSAGKGSVRRFLILTTSGTGNRRSERGKKGGTKANYRSLWQSLYTLSLFNKYGRLTIRRLVANMPNLSPKPLPFSHTVPYLRAPYVCYNGNPLFFHTSVTTWSL